MIYKTKATRLALCAALLLFCGAAWSVQAQRSLTKRQARLYLRNLPAIDKVELAQLASRDEGNRQDEERIVGSRALTGAEAQKLAALWRAQAYGPDRAACHEPSYSVTFYSRGQQLVHASVCWACSNILFFAPDFIGGLHFAGENRNGRKLERFFQRAFQTTQQGKSSEQFSFNSSTKKQ